MTLSGTNTLINSKNEEKNGSLSALTSALENANEEAIKHDRKDVPKVKKEKK